MNELRFYDTGEKIDFSSLDFEQNKSQFLTTFTIRVAGNDSRDFVGMRVVYTLGEQSYHFIIDDNDGGKTTTGNKLTLNGRSLTCLLDAPYAPTITRQTWQNTSLSVILTELCTAANLTLDLQIDDYQIPFYLAEEKTPLEIIKDLVNDRKAQMQTSLDGLTLIICHAFKVHLADLQTATPDKTLTRNFSQTWQLDNIVNFDAIRIFSELNNQNATVEQKTITDFIRARVFLSNWTNEQPLLTNCGGNVSVEYRGVKTVKKTRDDVQIDKGKGSLEANATVLSGRYYGTDLGTVSMLSSGDFTTAILENGLAKFRYSVPCHEFYLRSPACEKIRFDIYDPRGVLEYRIRTGNRYATDLTVKYFNFVPAMLAAGKQALFELQDFKAYSLPCDHWDDLPLPCDIVSFDGLNGYCTGFAVNVSKDKIQSTIAVRVPVNNI